jgi:putative tricarboxylic transport membrane protein
MPQRLNDIPDVPTAREAGYPQLEAIVGWSVLLGPPKLNDEALAKWVETLRTVGRDPAWIASEQKIGSIPRMLSPQETETFVGAQFGIYEQLARQLRLELN